MFALDLIDISRGHDIEMIASKLLKIKSSIFMFHHKGTQYVRKIETFICFSDMTSFFGNT